MADDGHIHVGTKFDGSTIESGINAIKSKLESLKKVAFGGAVAAGFDAISNAVKAAGAKIKELTDTYKAQAKAETLLQTAAKNNPFLNDTSVNALKNYASEMQSITTYGADNLLPYMANLASAGRTQAEIMDIMSAALDVAASGTMSLDSAVQGLNLSYSGQLGTFGKALPQLKGLTAEQLKNGEAVKLVAKTYAGMAEEVARTTGSAEQLANTWGDFKAHIGSGLEKALAPLRRALNGIISDVNDAIQRTKDAAESAKRQRAISLGSGSDSDYVNEYEYLKQNAELAGKRVEDTRRILVIMDEIAEKEKEMGKTGWFSPEREKIKDDIKDLQKEAKSISKEWQWASEDLLRYMEGQRDEAEKQLALIEGQATAIIERNEQESRAAALAAERAARDKEAAEFMRENDDALREKLALIDSEAQLQRELGNEVDEQAVMQEKLNALMSSYIDLITGSDLVSESNPFSQKRKQELLEFAEAIKVPEDAYKALQEAMDAIVQEESRTLVQQLKDQRDALTSLASGLDETSKLYEQYKEKLLIINEQIARAEREAAQAQKERIEGIISDVKGFIDDFAGVMRSATDLIKQSSEEQTLAELGDLSKMYTDGIISYEEYCDKKKEIEKKAQREQYKLAMFEWTTQLLQATANVAQGISKAIAQGGLAGIATGAVVAAAGAMQIATITANKPKPPSFATGGIVPGSSWSGDKVLANVNSGEMILNAAQQRQLWSMANGREAGGGVVVNQPITIHNSVSDKARVDAKRYSDMIRITVNEIVEGEMSKGTYTSSMQVANSKADGVKYL